MKKYCLTAEIKNQAYLTLGVLYVFAILLAPLVIIFLVVASMLSVIMGVGVADNHFMYAILTFVGIAGWMLFGAYLLNRIYRWGRPLLKECEDDK